MSHVHTTILFHGNCIDGWFAAYFAFCKLQDDGEVQMFPIAPSQPNTWPTAETMEGTHVWLLDVSVPEFAREEWEQAGALSIQCIDHHATAITQWPEGTIHTDCCAALQTWRFFYPELAEPEWLHSIDRVDRWVDVTYEDRCLREFLHDIARLPVQKRIHDALVQTDAFVHHMEDHPEDITTYQENGKKSLLQKDEYLTKLLETKGHVVVIEDSHLALWALPSTWRGLHLFLMDTTDIILDTTEASYLAFSHHPHIHVFINYRQKTFYEKRGKTKLMKSMTVYSARSRELDLTVGTVLRGHPTSAGASLVSGETEMFPFLITSL